jgi:PTS system ascorbate-specific IIB component
MIKILVVCGNGLGTSLMMEMAVKDVVKKLGLDAEVDHEDLSSATSSQADIWVAAADIAVQLQEAGKENIISLTNIFDKVSIEEQLKALIQG